VVVCSLRDNGLFPGTVSYYPGVAVNAQDTSAVDSAQVAQLAAEADYIVVCVGEGTYAEKPGDIDDLALPQVRSATCLWLCCAQFCGVVD
jgi:NADPH-dependent glutamate synthase beta subunit-like oxidoreductase